MGMLRPCSPPALAALVLGLGGLAVPALAQVGPDGIDWVTIGAPGNTAYHSDTPRLEDGRGSVGYEFKIGRYEVTAGQWVEFMNAARNRPDPIPWVEVPGMWPGGQLAPFRVSQANSMRAVGGVTWRTCAIFTNWLCNDKRLDRAAFMTGAYDVSTFGNDGNGGFTDQVAHTPGARYWIPTMDEWLKAANYDPNKANPDGTTGGWWTYNNGTEVRPIYGLPPSFGGIGEANAGFIAPGDQQFNVPLGSYGVTSPWGLYDTAGATREYTESVFASSPLSDRIVRGSAWATPVGNADRIDGGAGGASPGSHDYAYGFRIAAAVPPPASVQLLMLAVSWTCRRRRRGNTGPHC